MPPEHDLNADYVCGAGHHHRSIRRAVACDEEDGDMTDQSADLVAVRKALGHARGGLIAVAEALRCGRSNTLDIDAIERIAKECDDARALLNDGADDAR
jgi:hypothetical protein